MSKRRRRENRRQREQRQARQQQPEAPRPKFGLRVPDDVVVRNWDSKTLRGECE